MIEFVNNSGGVPKLVFALNSGTSGVSHKIYIDNVKMEEVVSNEKGYKYGFQGQEKDDDIKGAGNSYVFEYRIQDSRLGRFLSIDPLESSYPGNSPYAFAENRVIDAIELEGLEA